MSMNQARIGTIYIDVENSERLNTLRDRQATGHYEIITVCRLRRHRRNTLTQRTRVFYRKCLLYPGQVKWRER